MNEIMKKGSMVVIAARTAIGIIGAVTVGGRLIA